MTDAAIQESKGDARHRIAFAAGAVLLVAGLLLVTVVLPAEFAVDPLGVGARLGLLDLGVVGKQVEALNSGAAAETPQASIVETRERPFNHERVEFQLAPGGSIEYKYRLDKGQPLLFSWSATAPVNYEFHAEPDGAPRGYAQSYEKSSGPGKSGILHAPFPGIHGWYWENPTKAPVTVTLTTSGFFTLAHEFHSDGSVINKSFP
jgi:hypothetical protein